MSRGRTTASSPSAEAATGAPAQVVLTGPDLGQVEHTLRDLDRRGITGRHIVDPVQALAWSSRRDVELVVVSAGIGDPLLTAVVRAAYEELSLPVLLDCGTVESRKLAAAILAGAQPVMQSCNLVRRIVNTLADARRGEEPDRALSIGALALDPMAHDARVGRSWVGLGAVEFEVLHLLVARADSVVDRQDFLDRHWPTARDGEGALAAVVARVRRKLNSHGVPDAIRTVRGLGYRLDSSSLAGLPAAS